MPQNLNTAIQLINGNEFAGAMRDTNVAGTKDDSLGAQRNHARSLGAECDSAGRFAGCLLEACNEWRASWGRETIVGARSIHFTYEIVTFTFHQVDLGANQIQNMV